MKSSCTAKSPKSKLRSTEFAAIAGPLKRHESIRLILGHDSIPRKYRILGIAKISFDSALDLSEMNGFGARLLLLSTESKT